VFDGFSVDAAITGNALASSPFHDRLLSGAFFGPDAA
jgi:hypothetical protein